MRGKFDDLAILAESEVWIIKLQQVIIFQ